MEEDWDTVLLFQVLGNVLTSEVGAVVMSVAHRYAIFLCSMDVEI